MMSCNVAILLLSAQSLLLTSCLWCSPMKTQAFPDFTQQIHSSVSLGMASLERHWEWCPSLSVQATLLVLALLLFLVFSHTHFLSSFECPNFNISATHLCVISKASPLNIQNMHYMYEICTIHMKYTLLIQQIHYLTKKKLYTSV